MLQEPPGDPIGRYAPPVRGLCLEFVANQTSAYDDKPPIDFSRHQRDLQNVRNPWGWCREPLLRPASTFARMT